MQKMTHIESDRGFHENAAENNGFINVSWVFVVTSVAPLKVLVARKKNGYDEVTFPGGKVAQSESYKQTAIRELGEEMFICRTEESITQISDESIVFCRNEKWYRATMFVLFLDELGFVPVCAEPDKLLPWEEMDFNQLMEEIDLDGITNSLPTGGWIERLLQIVAEAEYGTSNTGVASEANWRQHVESVRDRLKIPSYLVAQY